MRSIRSAACVLLVDACCFARLINYSLPTATYHPNTHSIPLWSIVSLQDRTDFLRDRHILILPSSVTISTAKYSSSSSSLTILNFSSNDETQSSITREYRDTAKIYTKVETVERQVTHNDESSSHYKLDAFFRLYSYRGMTKEESGSEGDALKWKGQSSHVGYSSPTTYWTSYSTIPNILETEMINKRETLGDTWLYCQCTLCRDWKKQRRIGETRLEGESQ